MKPIGNTFRSLSKNEQLYCLHLGCWDKFFPCTKKEKWVNIDIRDLEVPPNILFLKMNVVKLGFPDNSVDYIYACHLLEHFRRDETQTILKEWYRVLKPGGVIRIAVPDFDAIVEVYLKEMRDLTRIIGGLYGRQDYPENTHYTVFNYKKLMKELYDVGFRGTERYDHRQTSHAQIDDYSASYIPHKDFENGICISLNVQARKPL